MPGKTKRVEFSAQDRMRRPLQPWPRIALLALNPAPSYVDPAVATRMQEASDHLAISIKAGLGIEMMPETSGFFK